MRGCLPSGGEGKLLNSFFFGKIKESFFGGVERGDEFVSCWDVLKAGVNFVKKLVYLSGTFVLFSVFIVVATISALFLKFQNETNSKYVQFPPEQYSHPVAQSFFIAAGQTFFGLLVYIFDRKCPNCKRKKKKKMSLNKDDENAKEYSEESTKEEREEVISTESYHDVDIKELKDEEKSIEGMNNIEIVDEEDDDDYFEDLQTKPSISPLFFIIPGIGTSIGNALLCLGLILTFASVYSMLKSALVVFTSVLSVVFLKSRIWRTPHKWCGVFLVIIGTIMVGVSSTLFNTNHEAKNPILGSLMTLLGQFITACTIICKEYFLKNYDTDSIEIAFYEGFYYFIITTFALLIFHLIPGEDYGSFENVFSSLTLIFANPLLFLWVVVFVVNTPFLKILGNEITYQFSGTTRATLALLRTIPIWVIQLMRNRIEFEWLQLFGYLVLVAGTMCYNEVLFGVGCPMYMRWTNHVLRKNKKNEKKKKKK